MFPVSGGVQNVPEQRSEAERSERFLNSVTNPNVSYKTSDDSIQKEIIMHMYMCGTGELAKGCVLAGSV
jgi:hypothetical protein